MWVHNQHRVRVGLLLLLAVMLGTTACNSDKETVSAEQAATPPAVATVDPGQALYADHCLICHQRNGSGVPGLQPPLAGSTWVQGDPERLVRLVLQGSEAYATISGEDYSNVMPGFAHLSDADLTALLNYVRQAFGNQASLLSENTVSSVRASP